MMKKAWFWVLVVVLTTALSVAGTLTVGVVFPGRLVPFQLLLSLFAYCHRYTG